MYPFSSRMAQSQLPSRAPLSRRHLQNSTSIVATAVKVAPAVRPAVLSRHADLAWKAALLGKRQQPALSRLNATAVEVCCTELQLTILLSHGKENLLAALPMQAQCARHGHGSLRQSLAPALAVCMKGHATCLHTAS